MKAQAIVFDFNGTLSDDEPILYRIFAGLFAEHGRPLTQQEYLDQLAGLSDPEIVGTWLGHDSRVVDAVVEQRIERYCAAGSPRGMWSRSRTPRPESLRRRPPVCMCSP